MWQKHEGEHTLCIQALEIIILSYFANNLQSAVMRIFGLVDMYINSFTGNRAILRRRRYTKATLFI